jgi:uncharacterized repeat protein (TIGR03943 family)
VTAAGATITVLLGTVILRLAITGTYRRYVRVGMGPWLVAAGVVIVVLGVVALVRVMRHGSCPDAHDHHRPSGAPRVGWLLLAPVAALLLVAPPTLGSYGVERGAVVDVRSGVEGFEPLPADGSPRPMSLLEFGQRAFDRAGVSFNGAPVQLTGFVADSDPGEFLLARYQIACCAADAAPYVVQVVGVVGDPPAIDQWVTVTGSFQAAATTVAAVPPPDDPYE